MLDYIETMNNVLEDIIRRELYKVGYELDDYNIKIYPDYIDYALVLFSLSPNIEYLLELRMEFYEESPEYAYFSKKQYGLYDKEKKKLLHFLFLMKSERNITVYIL